MLFVLSVEGTVELRAWALDSDTLGTDPGSAAYWKSPGCSLTALNVGLLTLEIIVASAS